MKLNAFFKGLIMAVIGFVVTLFTGGEEVSFAYVAIATGGFTLVYVAKNYYMPSVSALGIELKDVISGLILAVGMALSSTLAQIATDGFSWKVLLLAVGGAVVGYFGKTAVTNSKA